MVWLHIYHQQTKQSNKLEVTCNLIILKKNCFRWHKFPWTTRIFLGLTDVLHEDRFWKVCRCSLMKNIMGIFRNIADYSVSKTYRMSTNILWLRICSRSGQRILLQRNLVCIAIADKSCVRNQWATFFMFECERLTFQAAITDAPLANLQTHTGTKRWNMRCTM